LEIFFSYNQLKHNPPSEFFADEIEPYLEVADRARLVLDRLIHDVRFKVSQPRHHKDWAEFLLKIHDPLYLAILKEVSESARQPGDYYADFDPESLERNSDAQKIFEFCYDTLTPIGYGTWESAYWSALSALNAAELLRKGKRRVVFALTRPPGHHAGQFFFGGYCYLNNAALAAEFLAVSGKVAILDFDFHHGNGTESIFYARRRVLYTSIHCAPILAYPFYTGSADARGTGRGTGYNFNIPLQPNCGEKHYRSALHNALRTIKEFSPRYLVVSAGFDIFADDPDGSFDLTPDFSEELASSIASLDVSSLIVLEGGYNLKLLPQLVYTFLLTMDKKMAGNSHF